MRWHVHAAIRWFEAGWAGGREALGRCVGVTTGGAALSLDSIGEVAAAARDNVSKPLKIHKYTNTKIRKYTNTQIQSASLLLDRIGETGGD